MIKLQVPNNPRELRAAAEFFAGLCNCLVEPRPVRDEGMTVNGIGEQCGIRPYTFVADTITDSTYNIDNASIGATSSNPQTTPEPQVTVVETPSGTTTTTVYGNQPFIDPTVIHHVPNQCGKDPGSMFEQATRTPDPQAGKTGVVPHYELSRTGADPVPNLDGQTHGGQPVFNTAGPIPPPVALQPTEVVVDKSGIPWDERIHSAGKTMLASGLFRMKKCPGNMTKDAWEVYIAEVKEDLKKLMGVPTPPPPPEGAILTLSALTEAILKAKKTPVDVQTVCSSMGLNGFPELGARPDLIPDVAAALGL